MADNPTSAGGAPGQVGDQGPESEKVPVSYETHQKLLREKKKLGEELANNTARLAAFEKEKQEGEEKSLIEQKKWQQVAEAKEKRVKELETKFSEVENRLVNSLKAEAFSSALSGEIEDQYWPLVELELSKIPVDPTTGKPDAVEAQRIAKEFEQKYSAVVKTKGAPKTLPNGAAQGANGKITVSEWKALGSSKKMKENQSRVDWTTD